MQTLQKVTMVNSLDCCSEVEAILVFWDYFGHTEGKGDSSNLATAQLLAKTVTLQM